MDFSLLAKQIEEKGIPCLRDEPMAKHCSFRIGGPAALMALPRTEAELVWLWGLTENPLVLGKGTNLLVTDKPLSRLVIQTSGLDGIQGQGNRIWAGAGASLARIALFALEQGLTGLEFAHGIPGSLGGALLMNAGAYGGEMAQVASMTRYLDEEGVLRQALGPDQGFAYRESAFSQKDCVILGGELSLQPGDKEKIRAQMEALMEKRRTSQPLDRPSAGSTFKRPAQGYAAALIDQAGLKGYAVGGAQVSEKHAGFVINRGGASFEDVLRLMAHIQKTVFDRSGVELTPEVRIIGG